jgi:hypothetical protein
MMWGDAEYCRRQEERIARERRHHEEGVAEAAEIERFIASAETDRDAALVVAMSKLIGPDGWGTRPGWLASAEKRRSGPRANDPQEVNLMEKDRYMGAFAVKYSLDKARAAIALVREHDAKDAR